MSKALQARALTLLAAGMDIDAVADYLDIAELTLCNWLQRPRFERQLCVAMVVHLALIEAQQQPAARAWGRLPTPDGLYLRHEDELD